MDSVSSGGLRPFKHALIDERGVFSELTAVLIFVVLIVVFALGFDAGYVKLVASRTRAVLDAGCRTAANDLPITKAVSLSLERNLGRQLVESGIVGGVVDKVEFVTPTAPNVGQIAGGAPFLGVPQALTCPGLECTLYGDVEDPNIVSYFPPNFWTRRNFNDSVACSADVIVRTLLSGERRIRTTVAWEIRQIGAAYPQPSQPLLPGLPNTRDQYGGGLIILVDPTVTTKTADTATTFSTLGTPPPEARYNPIRDIGTSFGVRAFSGARPSYTPKLVGNAPLSGNARIERAHACMSLPVAVRNRFLVGIIGRARGWLRDKLAVYVTNPYHRAAREKYVDGFFPSEPNPPSLLVQGGMDVMSGQFELPYVHYQVNEGNKEELNPFTANTDAAQAAQDRLMIGQLRDCYHLYGGAAVQGNIDRVTEGSLRNNGFEFPEVYATSTLTALAAYTTPSLGTYPWDQEIGGPVINPYLSAEQVVSMLGTVQICPHGGTPADPGAPPCDESGGKPLAITDPNLPTTDLRGDLQGALMAINGGRILPTGDVVPFPAYTATALPGTKPSEGVFSKYASVLIVLHRRLGPDEASGINEQVRIFKESAALGRRMIVAYFPTSDADVHPDAITRIKDTFAIDSSPYPAETSNVLLVFSPTERTSTGQIPFKTYWQDQLRDGMKTISHGSRGAFRMLFVESPKL